MYQSNNTSRTAHHKLARHATIYTAILMAGFLSACSLSGDPDSEAPEETIGLLPPEGNPENGGGSMPSPTIDLVPETRSINAVGTIYTNDDGGALYTRYTDEPGVVTCTLDCAQTWPPHTTSVTEQGISGNFDVIPRDEGTSQWTLLGYPLYSFAGDAAPDDVNGDGVDNQWALARPIPVTSADIDGDEALVAAGTTRADGNSNTRQDRDNYTLYVFANDTEGASSCNGNCASSWPPLYADIGAVADGNRYTLITREDGTQQWAYDGKALYFWQGDNAAGEFNGADVPDWSVARP